MKLDIHYEPSVEKIYKTSDVFSVVDKETEIGLNIIDDRAFFVGRDIGADHYNERSFAALKDKLTPQMLVAFVDAYKNRKAQ